MKPLLLFLLLAACAPATATPDPPVEVRCELLGLDTTDEFAVASFRITNGSSAPFAYHGYEGGVPLYALEVLENGAWQESPIGWCGTGATEHVLEPGATADFQASVPADGRTYRFRFGEPPVVTPSVSAPPK